MSSTIREILGSEGPAAGGAGVSALGAAVARLRRATAYVKLIQRQMKGRLRTGIMQNT